MTSRSKHKRVRLTRLPLKFTATEPDHEGIWLRCNGMGEVGLHYIFWRTGELCEATEADARRFRAKRYGVCFWAGPVKLPNHGLLNRISESGRQVKKADVDPIIAQCEADDPATTFDEGESVDVVMHGAEEFRMLPKEEPQTIAEHRAEAEARRIPPRQSEADISNDRS